MGLDARVGKHYSMRMGSYSSIQTQRRKLIELVIEYCKIKDAQLKEAKRKAKEARNQADEEQVQKDEDTMDSSDHSDSEYDEEFDDAPDWQSILEALKSWIAPQSHMMIMLPGFEQLFQINYPNLVQTKEDLLAEGGLLGLKWFVHHSDTDGYWSPGQSYDILNLLKELRSHDLIDSAFNDDDNPYLELLETSIKYRVPVTFC